jgi:hypothetical protein
MAKKKQNIPKRIKRLVWDNYIGEDFGKGKCQCCFVAKICQMDFQCGHIVSEYNGGGVTVDNLKPICASCNNSMGTTNMDVFMRRHGLGNNKNTKIKNTNGVPPIIIDLTKESDEELYEVQVQNKITSTVFIDLTENSSYSYEDSDSSYNGDDDSSYDSSEESYATLGKMYRVNSKN